MTFDPDNPSTWPRLPRRSELPDWQRQHGMVVKELAAPDESQEAWRRFHKALMAVPIQNIFTPAPPK